MIRGIIFLAILMSALAAKAQVPLFYGAQGNSPLFYSNPGQSADTSHLKNKWFITKYAGISTGLIAYKGGSTSYLSAPLELMINRQFTNNIYAFGGVSVAPYLLQNNGAFYQNGINKQYGLMQNNNFSMNPAARIGVMYINDNKTFSVSGSISVSRSTYNGYAPVYAPAGAYVR